MPYIAIIDFLTSLQEAESNSIFRFLSEGGSYLSRAPSSLREPLLRMYGQSETHADQLLAAVQSLGGAGDEPRGAPDEQYLTYLSFSFLLPKLIEAKKLMARRYRNGLPAVAHAPLAVLEMLARQMKQNEADADFLMAAMKSSRPVRPHASV